MNWTKVVVVSLLLSSVLLLSGNVLAASKVQDKFLDALIADGVRTTLVMVTGEKMECIVKAYDDEVIEVDSQGPILVNKKAIMTISTTDGNL